MRHLIGMVLATVADRLTQPTVKQQAAEAKVGILESLNDLVHQSVFYVEARTDCLRADQELMKAEAESQKASSQATAQLVEVVKPIAIELLTKYLDMMKGGEDDPKHGSGDDFDRLKVYALPAYPQVQGEVVSISMYLDFLKNAPGERVAWTGGPVARLEEVARELAYEGYGLRMETEAHGKTILIVDVLARGTRVAPVGSQDAEDWLNRRSELNPAVVVLPQGTMPLLEWVQQQEDTIAGHLENGLPLPFSLVGPKSDVQGLAIHLVTKGYTFGPVGHRVNKNQPGSLLSWCEELRGVPYGVAPKAPKVEEIPTVDALPTHDEDGKRLSQKVLVSRYAREAYGRFRVNGWRPFQYVGESLAYLWPLLTGMGFTCDWSPNPQKDGTLLMGRGERLTILGVPSIEQTLSEGPALEFVYADSGVSSYGSFLSEQWGPAKSPVYVFFGKPKDHLVTLEGVLNALGYRCEFSIGDDGSRHELAVYLLPPGVEAKLAELPRNRVG